MVRSGAILQALRALPRARPVCIRLQGQPTHSESRATLIVKQHRPRDTHRAAVRASGFSSEDQRSAADTLVVYSKPDCPLCDHLKVHLFTRRCKAVHAESTNLKDSVGPQSKAASALIKAAFSDTPLRGVEIQVPVLCQTSWLSPRSRPRACHHHARLLLHVAMHIARQFSIDVQVRDITTNEEWFSAYQYEIPVLTRYGQ